MPANSPSPAQEAMAAVVAESETRITSYVDTRLGDLRNELTRRLDAQDAFAVRQDEKLDRIYATIVDHTVGEGHPATLKRVEHLEEEVKRLRGRPLATWQMALFVFGTAVSTISFAWNLVHSLVN